MRILVTGANGFLGKSLMHKLRENSNNDVIGTVRAALPSAKHSDQYFVSGDINRNTSWQTALENIDVVIHTAGRAHILKNTSKNPLSIFREVNVDGTIQLATQAAKMGVKRFIFISSIGVNGASTNNSQPFTENSFPSPHADYAISKYEAEQELVKLSNTTKMELTIIRPPLIYGPDAPGNFRVLLKILYKKIPLPLANIKNKRSFIYLGNLVDFINVCIQHPNAANQTFLISDDHDISTPHLIKILAKGMNKSLFLFPMPTFLIKWGAIILKREPTFQQLCGSLQINIQKAKELLNWTPPIPTNEALILTANSFIKALNRS